MMNQELDSAQAPVEHCSSLAAESSHSTDGRKRILSDSETSASPKRPCIAQESPAAENVPSENQVFEQAFNIGSEIAISCTDQVSPVKNLNNSKSPLNSNQAAECGSHGGPSHSLDGPSCSNASPVQGRNIINTGITEEEINELINGLGDDIDSMLDMRAEKNKLTAKNVKSILRHVISNKYVLAMVRNTMRAEKEEECDLEEAVFEPKLTRSKAKELREKQAVLPWPVAATPVKKNISNKILSEEFSDDEGSSDEDYKPNEEELHSGGEEDKTKDLNKSIDPDAAEDLPPLLIAEAGPSNNDKDEDDRIALRTRSKLPLTDTPLEKIEASFVAPDITCDLYDTVCDNEEWQNFLKSLVNPFEQEMAEQADDDENNDPEYNVMEDECAEEHEDEGHESDHDEEQAKSENDENNIPYDKVTSEELSGLVKEILECAGEELREIEEAEQEQASYAYIEQPMNVTEMVPCVVYTGSNLWFNPHERLQLEQQMRMHVQLLCQSFLLSYGIEAFTDTVNKSSIEFLEELKMLASVHSNQTALGRISCFQACNLNEALEIVNKFRCDPALMEKVSLSSRADKKAITPIAREVIACSKVFIYPDLLPTVGYQAHDENKSSKTVFTRAEDYLIAMGLEQFTETEKPISHIHKLLLPGKSEQQIKYRIKNVRTKKENPIPRALKFKEWPRVSRYIRSFNPLCIIPPCNMPMEVLPAWMAPYIVKPALPMLAPQVYSNSPTEKVVSITHATSAITKPLLCKVPERKKYPPILPRGYVSPLKKISPILKKYHRRIVPMPAICITSPAKTKHRIIKPKAPSESQSIPSIFQNKPVQVQPKSKPLAIVNPFMACEPEVVVPIIISDSPIKKSPTEVPLLACKESKQDSELPNLSDVTEKADKEPIMEADSADVTDNAEADVDDEQDLAALMAASSTICRKSSAVKKKNKQQRDLESSLALLSPSLMESDPKKEERDKLFAQMYLMRVMEALKGYPEKCERFLELLCTFENSSRSTLQLYSEVSDLLKDHPALVDDFAGFLLPEQARDCGKYIQHRTLCKIREFLRKIEVHFANQPHHVQRILRAFTQLRQQKNITSSTVMATLQPLLKNQTHLIEELMQLLPDGPPPECLMMDSDFEEIRIPNSDGENSADSFEEIVIPETKDPYGGKDCPCSCHTSVTDVRMANRSRHCSKCGTKFIDGRIYIQTGKVLKPAHVTYHEPAVTLESPLKDGKADSSHNAVSAADGVMHSKSRSTQNDGAADCRTPKKSTANTTESPQQANKPQKDILKAATETLGLESHLSSVPCYVEDAVLLADSGNRDKDIPSDFSCLSKVISAKGTIPGPKSSISSTVEPAFETSEKQIIVEASGSGLQKPSLGKSLTKTLPSEDATILSPKKWTKEEDRVILETCEKHGLTMNAFTIAATSISKTVHQVKGRFFELMEFTKNHMKAVVR